MTKEPPVKPNPHSIEEIRRLIKEHGLEPGSPSESRKLLDEGLQLVRDRVKYNEMLKQEGGLSLDTDKMRGWVDNMIENKLGGTRKGDKIIWSINGGTIELDPISGNLICNKI